MVKLNFPTYEFRIQENQQETNIYDPARRRYVKLTPEEWVRQHIVHYLYETKHFPLSLISVEKRIPYNRMYRRYDIVVSHTNTHPLLVVECKAPSVPISEDVFRQISTYNTTLHCEFLMVSNGLQSFCCRFNPEKQAYIFVSDLPDWGVLSNSKTLAL